MTSVLPPDDRDCGTVPDALVLAQGAAKAGIIRKDVLDHLTSLQPQVPNSMKLRYLLIHLRNTIDNDEQLFVRMVQVFLAFRSHPMTASSASTDIPLDTEHIPDLAELLVEYASKWKSIGIALRFRPQDLDNIQACHVFASPKDCLLQLLSDWVQKTYNHTLLPTVNALEGALNGRLVALGVVACKLKSNFTLNKTTSVLNQALPYFVESLALTEGYDSLQSPTLQYDSSYDALESFASQTSSLAQSYDFYRQSNNKLCTMKIKATSSYSKNIDRLQAEEKGSVLLEIQVCLDKEVKIEGLKYQWLINGRQLLESVVYTGTNTSILCISNADIEMDGSKYSCMCEVAIGGKPTIVHTTRDVTLRVSCPLDQHTLSLASVYSAQPKVPEDTWPPVRSTKHINLALIKQGKVSYGAEYPHLTIRGDMDDVLQQKEKIEYDEVLKCLKSRYVLFIEGRPGSGKTTFVHKITQDWATAPDGANRLVLLVSLRVLNDLNKPNLNLSDILNLFEDLKVSKELLEDRNGKGVCFIFDGLDEFSPQDGDNSLVYKIINKVYLNQSSVIVASRPAAIAELISRADKVIEVLGFPNEQIFEYFDHYPFSVSSKSNDLKAYLPSHPNILHMCYLPIHTAMVAFLFEVTGEVPKTETEIYRHFTRFTLMRSLTKNKAVSADSIAIESLSGEDRTLFNQICKLALEKTVANKQVLHQDEVNSHFQSNKGGDISLGLITVDRTAGLYGFKEIYTFLHLTFQEYLAAYHISTLSDEEQHKLIQLYGDKKHMVVVWKFFCGLVKFDTSDGKFKTLALKTLANHLFLIQSAYESQQPVVCTLLLELLQASFEFEDQYLTITDFTALGYVMANTLTPLSLSFGHCNLSIEAVDAMLSESEEGTLAIHALRYYSKNFDSQCFQKMVLSSLCLKSLQMYSTNEKTIPTVTSLFKACTDLTTLCTENICMGPANLETTLLNCEKLQELVLKGSIRNSGIHVLATNLKHCKNLKILDVSSNGLAKDAELLAPGLVLCKNIESLVISDNRISSASANVLLTSLNNCNLKVRSNEITEGNEITVKNLIESLADCRNLQELHLTGKLEPTESISLSGHCHKWQKLCTLELNCCVDKQTVFGFSKGLKNLTKLKVLRVISNAFTEFSDYGAVIFANGLSRCINLTEFTISHCNIGDEGAQELAGALHHCSVHIRMLDLSYNRIGNVGAEAIFTSTRHMAQLKSLSLSRNLIEHTGAITILIGLKFCNNLSRLNLNENCIGAEGAMAVSICLQHWPNLQTLGLCGNREKSNIGRNGAVTLANNLLHCTELRALNLSHNSIDDEAATSLVMSLTNCTNLTELYLGENSTSRNSHYTMIVHGCTTFWKHLKHLTY